MYDTPLAIDEVVRALAQQAATIVELTRDARAAGRRPPGEQEWSLNDVLAHLRACSDVWGGYMRRIAEQEHPTFRAVNPRTWIDSTDYPSLEFTPSLHAYREQRDELVAFLRALPRAAWSRSATVTGGGRPRERTVLEYARWLANHERSHLRQIARLAGEATRPRAGAGRNAAPPGRW